MKIVSRKDAKDSGVARYFTGNPCVRGHIGERMASSGACCICLAENKKKYRRENPGSHKQYMAEWHCKNADKERQYRVDNAEIISNRSRMWRLANADRHSENAKSWRLNNKDRSDQNRKNWRKNNPDRAAMLSKRWRMNNPEKQKVIMFNRNCITRGLRQYVKHGLVDRLMKLQDCKCIYCAASLANVFDIDHIMPISRGGDNDESNLQLLCPGCNRSKRDKTHIEYMEWRKNNAAL